MPEPKTKINIIPLSLCEHELEQSLPFELGSGISVQNVSHLISQSDLTLLDSQPEQQQNIRNWSICLVYEHDAFTVADSGNRDPRSLLDYVVAHLRFIVPNRSNSYWPLEGWIENQRFITHRYCFSFDVIGLEDCEANCSEIKLQHLEKLKRWMPWILRIKQHWMDFYPLYVSLCLYERSWFEYVPLLRHLLLVMALEALISSEISYGKRALVPRMRKLLGSRTDLYQRYRSEIQPHLPSMLLEDVVEDVYSLRNKIAHGDKIPEEWIIQNRRSGNKVTLHYADELREAAMSMVALAWNKIIDENLQQTFADKTRMESFFNLV